MKEIKRTWELSEIKTYSYLAENCGNVAAMERFLLGLFPALAIALIPVWGFLHSLLFGVVMEVIVIVGSFAGHPLLKFMQLPKVAAPGDNELELARTGIQRLLEYSARIRITVQNREKRIMIRDERRAISIRCCVTDIHH